MMNEIKLFIALAIVLGGITLATTLVDDAEAKGRNAPEKLYCDRPAYPFVSVAHMDKYNLETEYNIFLNVYQKFGDCTYLGKRGLNGLYEVPYYPIETVIELYDADFPETLLEKQSVKANMDELLWVQFDNLYADIPYNVRVTSSYIDAGNKVESITGGMFFEELWSLD